MGGMRKLLLLHAKLDTNALLIVNSDRQRQNPTRMKIKYNKGRLLRRLESMEEEQRVDREDASAFSARQRQPQRNEIQSNSSSDRYFALIACASIRPLS